jgi:hypothetical protein
VVDRCLDCDSCQLWAYIRHVSGSLLSSRSSSHSQPGLLVRRTPKTPSLRLYSFRLSPLSSRHHREALSLEQLLPLTLTWRDRRSLSAMSSGGRAYRSLYSSSQCGYIIPSSEVSRALQHCQHSFSLSVHAVKGRTASSFWVT